MEQTLVDMLMQFAHQPMLVYGCVFVFLYLSSFGLPIPEEVVLLTLGFLAHISMNPELYPTHTTESTQNLPTNAGVNIHVAAWVAFFAVVSSDFLVYAIGLTVGEKILRMRWVAKFLTEQRREKVFAWTHKFGAWAAGVFRFTPGVRFPGHLTCGILKVPWRRFLAVDSMAALISVPTQIYLVGFYGKQIIDAVRKYQFWAIALIALVVLWHFRSALKNLYGAKNYP